MKYELTGVFYVYARGMNTNPELLYIIQETKLEYFGHYGATQNMTFCKLSCKV